MSSRFTGIILFLACIAAGRLSQGQQIIADVPVSWIGLEGGPSDCDQQGRFLYRPYYRRDEHDDRLVVRVNQDGSTSQFQIPEEKERANVFASSNDGMVVIAARNDQPLRVFHLYHFDAKGKVVSQHTASFEFKPAALAVTSSGKTVLVGYVGGSGGREHLKPVGAILDGDDRVIGHFEFPPTTEGGNWMAGWIAGGDGVAYEILKSWGKPTYSLATIAESGRIDIRVLPAPPEDKMRHHLTWQLGPGVVVESDSIDGQLPNLIRFDEYDLQSGKKLRTTSMPPPNFPNGLPVVNCYGGDELAALVSRVDGGQQSTRRVTLKLTPITGKN
jgi:hypothetical protein